MIKNILVPTSGSPTEEPVLPLRTRSQVPQGPPALLSREAVVDGSGRAHPHLDFCMGQALLVPTHPSMRTSRRNSMDYRL